MRVMVLTSKEKTMVIVDLICGAIGSAAILVVSVFVTVMNSIIFFCEDMSLQLRCYDAYKNMLYIDIDTFEEFMKSMHRFIYSDSSREVKIGRFTRNKIKKYVKAKYGVKLNINKISKLIYYASNDLNLEMALNDN